MMESDLLWMTALIFTPTVFALVLLVVPRGQEELMRWLALLGTAVTLAVSVIMLSQYLEMPGVTTPGHMSSLEVRADQAANTQAVLPLPEGGARGSRPAPSDDWVSRIPWIKAFNIDYYLGVDGISLPLILLTTGLSFLAIIASWNIEKYVKGYLMLF